MNNIFKIGDKVVNKHDKSYKGTITKTSYVRKKGLTFGDYQWLYLDNSNVPVGSPSTEWELDNK